MDTMVPGISIVDVDVMLSSQYRVSEKKKWKHKKKHAQGAVLVAGTSRIWKFDICETKFAQGI